MKLLEDVNEWYTTIPDFSVEQQSPFLELYTKLSAVYFLVTDEVVWGHDFMPPDWVEA